MNPSSPPSHGGVTITIVSADDFRANLLERLRQVSVAEMHGHHLELIEIITRVYLQMKLLQQGRPGSAEMEGLRQVLGELKEYALFHFRAEERFMEGIAFPQLERHRQAHGKFVEVVLQLEEKVFRDSPAYVVELLHLVVSWLFEHINQMDMQYSRAAQGQPLARELEPTPPPQRPSRARGGHSPGGPGTTGEGGWRLPATGIPQVDREHRELVERMGELERLVGELNTRAVREEDWDRVDALLEFLGEYAQTHFRHEEDLLSRYHYPGLARHVGEHRRFRERLAELVATLKGDRRITFVVDMRFFLLEWLLTHIARSDMEYVPFLQERMGRGEGV